jgi:hypothetical protein
MTVNRPEHRSFSDAGSDPPLFERNYRTPLTPTVRDTDFPASSVLIRFRTAKGDLETLTNRYDIIAV